MRTVDCSGRWIKEWQAEKSYVFCQGNIEEADGVTYLPWYEIMFLQPDRLPETMKFEVDISALP